MPIRAVKWYNVAMTIKKLKTVKAAKPDTGAAADAAAPAAPTGGATIADRFKLDVPDQKKGPTVSKKAAAVALTGGLLALAAAGALAFMLYRHWEFLKGA